MRFRALATDFDGTLAQEGRVGAEAVDAIKRLQDSGRLALLVTGRRLDDLRKTFPETDIFNVVVAENGALLWWPESGSEELLTTPPSIDLVAGLIERGIPVSIGRAVVGTDAVFQAKVEEVIHQRGLPLQVILNKADLMVLPEGVDKRTGLAAALDRLGQVFNAVVGIGDAQNDLTFLEVCGKSVAVANALPSVKAVAQVVTRGSFGAGVAEAINALILDQPQIA
jgi:hydroxymethylpyrimidine pyrophosphatase-like HAD family hydrolase